MQPETETSKAFISIDKEGILWLKIKDRVRVEKKDIVEMFEIYREWGCHRNKVLQVIKGGDFFVMNNAALQYASRVGKDYFMASALVNDSLAISLFFNFFNFFFKHDVPFKMFPTETTALKWLRKFN